MNTKPSMVFFTQWMQPILEWRRKNSLVIKNPGKLGRLILNICLIGGTEDISPADILNLISIFCYKLYGNNQIQCLKDIGFIHLYPEIKMDENPYSLSNYIMKAAQLMTDMSPETPGEYLIYGSEDEFNAFWVLWQVTVNEGWKLVHTPDIPFSANWLRQYPKWSQKIIDNFKKAYRNQGHHNNYFCFKNKNDAQIKNWLQTIAPRANSDLINHATDLLREKSSEIQAGWSKALQTAIHERPKQRAIWWQHLDHEIFKILSTDGLL